MIAIVAGLLLTAAAPVRLADLLEEARKNNPELRAAAAQARAAASSVSPAGAFEDPMLMVQFWNMPVDLSTVPVMVQLTQPIPLGGKRAARRDAAEAQSRMARADAATKGRDVEAEVAKSYFDLFMADRALEIDGEIERTLRSLAAAAEARVTAGKSDQVDSLKAETQLLKLKADEETVAGDRAAANARLVALLNREPGTQLGPTTVPAVIPRLPLEAELRQHALENRPELASLNATVAAAQAQLRLADAERIPDLSVFVGEMHSFRMPGVSDFLFVGVQGNLPIFSRSKNEPRIAAARAQLDAATAGEQSLRNRIAAEVAQAHARVSVEERQVELHHRLIPLARQTLESALASYSAGRIDFLTVLDSQRELQMHEMDLATHLAAYEQRVVELERAVGADLGLTAAAEAGHPESH